MNLNTLIRFLFFDRQAIDQIAGCRQALWFGLAFTLLAAVARDYDGVNLLGKPWHLFVPALASLVMARLLFGFLRLFRNQAPRMSFRQFLTFFWLMSPMAWIYAIPVEHFLSPLNAAKANFWFLALVATWRVLLISRIIAVREQAAFSLTLIKVLLLADTVVLLVLFFTPLPVFNIMGGIRLSERDAFIAGTAFLAALVGSLLWLVLVFINIVLLLQSWEKKSVLSSKDRPGFMDLVSTSNTALQMEAIPTCNPNQAVAKNEHHASPGSKSVWVLIATMGAASVVLLILGQPGQWRRNQTEKLFHAGQIEEGLRFISQYPQSDFPPHWTLPTSHRVHRVNAHPIDVAYEALKLELRPWVRAAALQSFTNYFLEFRPSRVRWASLDEAIFSKAIKVLELADDLDPEFLETTYTEFLLYIQQDPDGWQTVKLKNFLDEKP